MEISNENRNPVSNLENDEPSNLMVSLHFFFEFIYYPKFFLNYCQDLTNLELNIYCLTME